MTDPFWTPFFLAVILFVIWRVIGPRIRGALILCASLALAFGLFGMGLGVWAAQGKTGTGVRSHPQGRPTQLAKANIPAAYLREYQRAPKCRGLSWQELAAIGAAESDHGRLQLPGVRSGANAKGAAGPMQFIAPTWRRWGRGGNVYDPRDAIPAAARYLCSVGAGRDFTLGAAAYNAGPGAVEKFGGVPPYKETRIYVAKVNAWADAYRKGRF